MLAQRESPNSDSFFFIFAVMGASIVQAYNSVKDIVNKEQKGFITPTVFNSLASIAQLKIFNELMDEFVNGRKLTRQNFETINSYSYVRRKEEDLSTFIQNQTTTPVNGVIDKPVNMVKLISISYTDSDDNVTNAEIVYNPELRGHIEKSYLSSPTSDYKVAYIGNSTIAISPQDDTDQITVRYFRRPGSTSLDNTTLDDLDPFYGVNVVSSGIETVSPNSRNFMLPTHYLSEIVAEICEMVGVRLRDNSVQAYGQQKSAEQ